MTGADQADSTAVRLTSDTLYEVVEVIASSPQLEPVLDGVVGVLTRATACHACFVYLLDGKRLTLRAASPVYSHHVGSIEFSTDEGLVGWVVRRNTSAYIRESAQDDPRTNYVAALEEEHFQSIVAVPIPSRENKVLGAVVLHTVAPREFDEQTLDVLGHTASLIAGAIENAQLFEQARLRVAALTALTALSQRISAAEGRDQVVDTASEGLKELVGADIVRVYEMGPAGGTLRSPAPTLDQPSVAVGADSIRLLLDLLRPAAADRPVSATLLAALELPEEITSLVAAPLTSGTEQHGVVIVASARSLSFEAQDLVRAVANQMVLALNKAELIERLTKDTAVRDLFDALARGSVADVVATAKLLRVEVDKPVLALCAERTSGQLDSFETLETAIRKVAPRAVFEVTGSSARSLVTLADMSSASTVNALDASMEAVAAAAQASIGRSTLKSSLIDAGSALREAESAARVGVALYPAGGFLTYDKVGVYRYLIHVNPEDTLNDPHLAAIGVLVEYDSRRGSALLETLEKYLANRQGLVDSARALIIHPNTLRQRLQRIEKLTGISLASADLLALEVAVKLSRVTAAARSPT